jgi:hypothetical protein
MTRGFTLLFSVLIISVILTASFSLYNAIPREIIIASSLRDTITAFYATESGENCAIYWNHRFQGNIDPFNQSVGNTITCNQQSFAVGGSGPVSNFTLTLSRGGVTYPAEVKVTNSEIAPGITIGNVLDTKGHNAPSSVGRRFQQISTFEIGNVSCPAPLVVGEYVIDSTQLSSYLTFGNLPFVSTNLGFQTSPLQDVSSLGIPADRYEVTLVSWDGHAGKVGQVQPNEQFFVRFYDSALSPIGVTAPIDDLPAFCEEQKQTVNTDNPLFPAIAPAIDITGLVDSFIIEHACPSCAPNANSISGLCIILRPTSAPSNVIDPPQCTFVF